MPGFDNLSAEQLDQIGRFIEETDIEVIDDEMRGLSRSTGPGSLGSPPRRKIRQRVRLAWCFLSLQLRRL
jgi:hypothetical protein